MGQCQRGFVREGARGSCGNAPSQDEKETESMGGVCVSYQMHEVGVEAERD